ncbi:MAG: GNAT family N-acetyltransferase [Anaerolineae bacterium]|nr:GNAT family N-acetyltransferase [Anaerolineae bacterium]
MLAELTQAQQLPTGFTVRPATMADLETAVSLMNACSQVQVGRAEYNSEDTRMEWMQETFNLETNTRLVFSPDEELVGYIEIWDTQAVPVSPWVWGRVHPAYENLGIGTYLLTWAEARARQVFERVPADARVAMRCGSITTYEPARQLFQDFGMTPNRHFWTMQVDLEPPLTMPTLPDSLRIITYAELNDLTALVKANSEAFQDHWGYVAQPLAETVSRWRDWLANDSKFDPSLWFLAVDGDEIAGMSLCRLEAHHDPTWGWVDDLAVRRPWRRQGVALALLHHSFRELYARGQKTVGLGVDAASLTGATRLYEKAGMHVFREFQNFEKELRPGRDLSTQTVEA